MKQFENLKIKFFTVFIFATLFSCVNSKDSDKEISFETIDTDFLKGRLNHKQTISLNNLEKFHGHLCDGLVVGALAMRQAMTKLYPNLPIDRTNLRIVSKPSPCLIDVAVYLAGGSYQFNTFYVDADFEGLYIIQRIDNLKTVSVSLNKGIKPTEIDSLGNVTIKQELSPCKIDNLKKIEDDFGSGKKIGKKC